MSAAEVSPLDRLLALAPLSRLRQVVYAAAGRLHLVRFDRLRADRAQLRILLGLVHRARRTPFGRQHDFERVRSPDDFRRLVPLREPAELIHFPPDTWAAGSGPEAVRCRAAGLHTALSLVLAARPRAGLLQGRIAWLDDEPPGCFPLLARPSLCGPLDPAAVTCLVGDSGRIADFLQRRKLQCGADRPCRGLVAIIHTRQDVRASSEALRQLAGPGVVLVEMVRRAGTALAVTDPRRDSPGEAASYRLLADHGAYFEFVPAEQVGRRNPLRLTLGEVRPGVPYEVAITSPAGWWACRSGLVVAFDRLDPPTLRIAALAAPLDSPAAVTNLRGPHPRSAGSPAAPPGMSCHSPWSVPVDRG